MIQKYLIWLFLAVTALTLLLSPYLHTLLKIDNISSFLILALILLTAVPSVIWTGYLQGHKELVRVGGFNLSAALGKLIFATILAATFGANGGLVGILVGTVVGLLVLKLLPGVKLPALESLFAPSDPEEKRFIFSLKAYILMCLVVVGVFSFLQNYDIILAKALFAPATAGVYSGISILSNALYYVCFLLIWVILPEIQLGDHVNNRRMLATGYKLLGGLTVIVVLAELAFKGFLTNLLLGDGFARQGDLLIFASLYQLTLVAMTLYAYYLLVNRRRSGWLLVAITAVSCTALPSIFADTPLQMIRLLWLALLASFAVYWTLVRLFVPRRS